MWLWEPDSGEIAQRFETQAEAEEWLTVHFEELREIGISAVTLRESDRIVYGPMSLDPA